MAKIAQNELVNDLANVALGAAAGFALFWLTSHPTSSPLRKKLPEKKIKNLYLLPEIKIARKDKHIHLHHWFNVGALYMLLYWKKRPVLNNKLFSGFLVGSILQGLSYEDRFSFVSHLQEKANP